MTRLLCLISILCVLMRCLTSLYGYSGEGSPPIYGDYEAQRHWMEITVNLPVNEWYFNSTDNDLQYWGLDYPPLTAYHSYAIGHIARIINPKYVELHKSRGYETPDHKIFMRYTVLISDLLTYMCASYFYVVFISEKTQNNVDKDIEILVLLAYPGLIFIDHGHFQYNCVSLGLALYSFIAILKNRHSLSSVLFCLALNYKQMLLYYSLPVFFYFLAKCKQEFTSVGVLSSIKSLIKLISAVIITFSIIWLPFLHDKEQLAQLIRRLFPLDRGLFEDKVANFWCAVNILYKVRSHFSNNEIALMCSTLTFVSCLPSCINIFIKPCKYKLMFTVINCSLSFFLFSYQVHEKSILIVALPVMLCFKYEPLHCFWFLIVSTFSMFPLIQKDNLIIPFIALVTFYVLSVITICKTKGTHFVKYNNSYLTKIFYIAIVSSSFSVLLLICSLIFKPPNRYPDLFSLLISVYSAIHFMYFLIYFTYKQYVFKIKVKVH